MKKQQDRISFRIKMPSFGFMQFMKKTVFDNDAFSVFIENPKAALESAGVALDSSVTPDMLMRLKFTVIRARGFISKEKVKLERFEDIFGISRFIPGQDMLPYADAEINLNKETEAEIQYRQEIHTSTIVEYSEKSSETNRGANTSWEGQDAVASSKSDHWSTTKFDGERIFRPDDRFYRVPLLDAAALSGLITQFHIRLKEYGDY
ncbi:MAG: hypothetical protein LLF86_02625 [Nitrospiraceae bacterium]|nr:hypothetical protein [Nitrospiraceae bacterium]